MSRHMRNHHTSSNSPENRRYASPKESIILGVVILIFGIALGLGGYFSKSLKLCGGALFLIICGVLALTGGIKRIKQGEDINNTDYKPEQPSEEMNQIYESNKELIDTAKDKAPVIAMIISACRIAIPVFLIGLFTGIMSLLAILSGSFSVANIVELVVFIVCTVLFVVKIIEIVRAVKMLRGGSDD